jgi:hypothetical protein
MGASPLEQSLGEIKDDRMTAFQLMFTPLDIRAELRKAFTPRRKKRKEVSQKVPNRPVCVYCQQEIESLNHRCKERNEP